ncbi:AraC family transcriptional regulator [Achromobacter deleyi]|uniref:AraC family transcriptional regulator n=1 Tax=Achromobacter deleyi TaxID=1353891 RepID=UPI001493036B|nr:helix-turn-helix transcriptional regulator [Achromobacter deleyi]QVQ27334.1 helix-turn-helix transcriptional regulator [Achromobacter deleyi]UIP22928.1 helix-turn-helix transcriptional regulator [Achromobacter deleyi]
MRNTHIDRYDHLDRAVVAIGNDYPPGELLPPHAHRRAQLLYGATGVMHVVTRDGNWVVPPQRAVWIPAGVTHQVRMLGVSTRSAYIEPGAARAGRGACEVIDVSPLLRQLLFEAVDMPAEYDRTGRDGALAALLLHEVERASVLPLHIPLPRDKRLAPLCRAFVAAPDASVSPQAWADRLHMSLRTFSRYFRQQTGMAFSEWRQRACVVLALARLAAGVPVTTIALDFGYQSPAAFSTMFKRVLGRPPTEYLRQDQGRPAVGDPG